MRWWGEKRAPPIRVFAAGANSISVGLSVGAFYLDRKTRVEKEDRIALEEKRIKTTSSSSPSPPSSPSHRQAFFDLLSNGMDVRKSRKRCFSRPLNRPFTQGRRGRLHDVPRHHSSASDKWVQLF